MTKTITNVKLKDEHPSLLLRTCPNMGLLITASTSSQTKDGFHVVPSLLLSIK